MKKIILSLCLAIGIAQADTVATATNDAGGMIVITDVKCQNEKNLFVAYTVMANSSKTLMGCWTMDDNFIFIRWSDGDVRTYPFGIWDVKKKKGASL